jgi:hypothetical protein
LAVADFALAVADFAAALAGFDLLVGVGFRRLALADFIGPAPPGTFLMRRGATGDVPAPARTVRFLGPTRRRAKGDKK